MTKTRFWKVQTIGNDFVLVHASDVEGRDLAALAKAVCQRRFGIGSDGLLTVVEEGGVLHLRMFNPDGTEDFCGNGLRCAAVHAFNHGWLSGEFLIEHYGRIVHAEVTGDGTARTAIGPAVTDPESVPLNQETHLGPMIEEPLHGFVGTAINSGTTHFVTFVDSLPDDETFFRVAPRIETDPVFPDRTSVIFVHRTGPSDIVIRIWERGVGETLGCGTGSSAAAWELMRREGRPMVVAVRNPGGTLTVSTDDLHGSLVTASRPVTVYTGVF